MITPLPGLPMKPGSCMRPFFGVELSLVDDQGRLVEGNGVAGKLCISKPWPGLMKTVLGDHSRFLATYLAPFAGLYFTGDGAIRDSEGDYWITG